MTIYEKRNPQIHMLMKMKLIQIFITDILVWSIKW